MNRWKLILGGLLLGTYAALVLVNLGHDALWDDEANTALFAESVWRTGDTSAVLGHNVVAYRGGMELDQLHNRLVPPVNYYAAAPFVGLLPSGAFAARLPFALAGLASICLLVWWMWRANASMRTWALMSVGLLGNVALILFMRQSRYYVLALLFSLVVVYCYQRYRGRWHHVIGMSVAGALLMATHYLAWSALAGALLVDRLVFRGRSAQPRFRGPAIVAVAASQLVAAVLLATVWRPRLPARADADGTWVTDRLELLWLAMRDLNTAEFGVVVLLLVAPVAWLAGGRRDAWLLRIPLAIAVYVSVVIALAPQTPVNGAPVRYLVPLIPAFVFLTVRVIQAVPFRHGATALGLGVVLMQTNVVHASFGAVLDAPRQQPPRVTLKEYIGELREPQPSSTRETVDWLRRNAPPGRSVYALPEYRLYPLMFHAPEYRYAWQLHDRQRCDYPGLHRIHFKHLAAPDYIVAFGDQARRLRPVLRQLRRDLGARYRTVVLDVLGWESTRPELYYHSFKSVRPPHRRHAVQLLRKVAGGERQDLTPVSCAQAPLPGEQT